MRVIAATAFTVSDLPMILSIENHCSVDQQHLMACDFEHYFGQYLLRKPVSENETALPSPWALRKKIIIKNRKLPSDQRHNSVESVENGNEEAEQDYDDKKCQGIFNYIGVDSAKYAKYVTLFDTGELQFSEVKNDSIDDPVQSEDDSEERIMELGWQKYITDFQIRRVLYFTLLNIFPKYFEMIDCISRKCCGQNFSTKI